MKIVMVSKEANATDMALRLAMEGHKVRVSVMDNKGGEYDHHADGLIHKIDNTTWESEAEKADLIIFDDACLDKEMHKAKLIRHRTGVPIFGVAMTSDDIELGGKTFRGHEAAGMLEQDRGLVHELLKGCGCGAETESLSFSDIGEAIAHLKEHPVPHAIKPEVQGSGESYSYVSELPDGTDGIGFLETLPDRPNAGKIASVEIEEKVQGVECAVSSWFNGKEFIGPVNVNFEHKKFASSPDGKGLGFNTGEQGTTMFYDQRPMMRVKLFSETLAKIQPILQYVDFRGQIDANCIVNETGAHVLELTPRLGYPASYIEPELQITPWGDLFYAIASGHNITNKVKPGWAMGVVMCGENYPDWEAGHKKCAELPIYGVTADAIKNGGFHPYDVKINEKDRTVLTGCYIGCVTASGPSLWDCRHQIYDERIPKIYYPGMWYRHDIGMKMDDDMARLKQWGYDFCVEAPIESRKFRSKPVFGRL